MEETYTRKAYMYMERTYIWRGHTHKRNIHTEGTYTRRVRTHGGDIHAEGLTHGGDIYIVCTDCANVLDYLFGGLSTRGTGPVCSTKISKQESSPIA